MSFCIGQFKTFWNDTEEKFLFRTAPLTEKDLQENVKDDMTKKAFGDQNIKLVLWIGVKESVPLLKISKTSVFVPC